MTHTTGYPSGIHPVSWPVSDSLPWRLNLIGPVLHQVVSAAGKQASLLPVPILPISTRLQCSAKIAKFIGGFLYPRNNLHNADHNADKPWPSSTSSLFVRLQVTQIVLPELNMARIAHSATFACEHAQNRKAEMVAGFGPRYPPALLLLLADVARHSDRCCIAAMSSLGSRTVSFPSLHVWSGGL